MTETAALIDRLVEKLRADQVIVGDAIEARYLRTGVAPEGKPLACCGQKHCRRRGGSCDLSWFQYARYHRVVSPA